MIFDTTTILIFVFVFSLAYLFFRKKQNLPPGPFALPVIGNLPQIIKHAAHLHTYFKDLGKDYGGMFCVRIAGQLVLTLTDYDLMRQALVKQADSFNGRPRDFPIIKQTNGHEGVLFGNGESWKSLRRFTLIALRDFGVGKHSLEERVQEEARAVLEVMRNSAGKPFQQKELMQAAVANIICSVVFGSRYEYDDEKFQKLVAMVNYVISCTSLGDPASFSNILFVLKNRKMLNYTRKVDAFIDSQIKEHKETFDQGNLRDFVDLHIQSEAKAAGTEKWSARGIQRTIRDLFAAGTETTSTTLNWVLLFMIRYPEVQQKCFEELEKEVGLTKQPGLADKQNLRYIEATLLEIQRHATIVPLSVPHSTLQDTTLAGYDIPKDTFVLVNLYAVHMDPKLWDEPEEFRPERWLDENGQIKKKDTFIPFSIGPRACLGEMLAKMEIYLFFTSMVQQFTFKMDDEFNPPSLKGSLGITHSPASYKIRAYPR